CWCSAENKEVPSEQCFCRRSGTGQDSQGRSLHPKVHPCDMCLPILKHILLLAEHHGMHRGQKVFTGEQPVPNNFISVQTFNGTRSSTLVKHFRSNMDRASFVKSCKFHVSRKPFTCVVAGKDFLATLGYLHKQATHTRERGQTKSPKMTGLRLGDAAGGTRAPGPGQDRRSRPRSAPESDGGGRAEEAGSDKWRLLDEAQRHLYLDVMLENLALISSLGKALTLPVTWTRL
ncbi:hypothetical protein HPG69_007256, partial [Diceros bicornis minor]